MSKTYTYTENQYAALPRSERLRKLGNIAGYGGSNTSITGSSANGVTDHGQLTGIKCIDDSFSDYDRDIHLTADAAKMLAAMSGFEILTTTDTTKEATDKNVFSALRTRKEITDAIEGIDDMYLRKDIDDTAHGNITFDKKIGSTLFLDGWNGKGWEINADGSAIFDSENVRSDIFLGGKIGTPEFVSGFTGSGWQIDGADARATFDYTTIRKSMKVYELVYSQIWGLGGSDLITDCNKIKIIVDNGNGSYTCTIDTLNNVMRMNLRNGDYVRIQRDEGLNIRYLIGKVSNVTTSSFDLTVTDGEDIPVAGDVAFRVGNESDKSRQGLIYLTSSDDYASYIDVLDGITDGSFAGKTKVRLGNLQGITVSGNPLDGYGIYINGGIYENCTYYLSDGKTVEQKFEVMNGKLNSEISTVKNDLSSETGNLLRNSSFSSDTKYWSSASTAHFITVDDEFLYLSGYNYIEKNNICDIIQDSSRKVLRILNNTITQTNDCLIIPVHETAGPYTYSFALYYKVLRAGTLCVGFTGTDLYDEETLTVSDTYKKLSKVEKWNETGDFTIAFDGEILIYGVALLQDELADAKIELQTQILQNAEAITLRATKSYVDSETGKIYTKYNSELSVTAEQISGVSTRVDNINNTISQAGWITTADGNTLFASKSLENGSTIISKINQTPTSVQIDASHIYLTGAVTFSMFASDSQNKINTAQSTANTANANANSALASIGSLPSWSKQASITKALQDETIISGGYISTTLIDADAIYVKHIDASVDGTIGGFTINASDLTASSDGNKMYLCSSLLKFTSSNVACSIGTSTFPSEWGDAVLSPILIKNYRTGSYGQSNVGIAMSVTGASESDLSANYGNHALFIWDGDVCGLRLRTRRVNSTQTLSNMDHVLFVNSTSAITLTLPASPKDGHILIFKNIYTGSFTINGNGKDVNMGRYDNTTSFTSSDGSTIILIYDSANNRWQGGYSNHT